MPTGTYYRLPKEKRERIEDAALTEFAEHTFDNASINRIVKAAGIPRGSFYQYFDGKEDIYLLIMNQIAREKLRILSQVKLQRGGSFFETLLLSIPAIFAWAKQYPRYQQIGLMVARDGSDFVKQIVRKMDHSLEELERGLRSDREKGYIRKDVDLEIVTDLYLSQMTEILKLYQGADSERRMEEKVRALIDIIVNGIGTGRQEGGCGDGEERKKEDVAGEGAVCG